MEMQIWAIFPSITLQYLNLIAVNYSLIVQMIFHYCAKSISVKTDVWIIQECHLNYACPDDSL